MRMAHPKKSCIDSLFDVEYPNTQPLRKYEPLIRVNLDGKPLPRKLLNQEAISFKPVTKQEPKQDPKHEPQPESKHPPPPQQQQQQQQHNDRKRSAPANTESKLEPSKKQVKSTAKITDFFKKS